MRAHAYTYVQTTDKQQVHFDLYSLVRPNFVAFITLYAI